MKTLTAVQGGRYFTHRHDGEPNAHTPGCAEHEEKAISPNRFVEFDRKIHRLEGGYIAQTPWGDRYQAERMTKNGELPPPHKITARGDSPGHNPTYRVVRMENTQILAIVREPGWKDKKIPSEILLNVDSAFVDRLIDAAAYQDIWGNACARQTWADTENGEAIIHRLKWFRRRSGINDEIDSLVAEIEWYRAEQSV